MHQDKNGNLAVVAVMMNEGEANQALQTAWKDIPMEAGEEHGLTSSFSAEELLPNDREYYRFSGSLTTPPCSEGVQWLVMKSPVSVSQEQLQAFDAAMHHHPNNRPIQPVNARTVVQ